MRDTLIYRQKDESLGGSLILCPFSGIIVVSFPPGPMIYLDPVLSRFWLDSGARCGINILDQDLKYNQKVIGFSCYVSAFITQWTCLAKLFNIRTHRVHSWV